MTFEVYKSEYNPSSLIGQVGGDIGTEVLSGYIDELFYTITATPEDTDITTYQYRKLYIKNEYSTPSTNTRVWIDALEHEDQISLSLSTGFTGTISNPTGEEPVGATGWQLPTNYAEGIDIGTLPSNGYTGVWVRQSLSGISIPDPYATFRVYIGGLV
jgi:hypothetical protein